MSKHKREKYSWPNHFGQRGTRFGRSNAGMFTRPGRLDLVSTGFGSVDGRVFDAGRLSEMELQQLGLAKSDSMASDHLMLVADCDFFDPKAADQN